MKIISVEAESLQHGV